MHILLVEDDQKLGKLISHMLKKEKHTVDWLDVGDDAYFQATISEYDLLILDWMLPGEDGISICRRLRANGYDGAILMLTAKDSVSDRVCGLDAGADDYLIKPFEFDELFARIRALARRSTAALQPEVITVANLVVDLAQRKVEVNGESVQMTPREFQLLELLLRNQGQVVPREIIYDRIWGYDTEVSNNTLDAFIRLLRKKIEQPGKQKYIHNVRGVGYKFEA